MMMLPNTYIRTALENEWVDTSLVDEHESLSEAWKSVTKMLSQNRKENRQICDVY